MHRLFGRLGRLLCPVSGGEEAKVGRKKGLTRAVKKAIGAATIMERVRKTRGRKCREMYWMWGREVERKGWRDIALGCEGVN